MRFDWHACMHNSRCLRVMCMQTHLALARVLRDPDVALAAGGLAVRMLVKARRVLVPRLEHNDGPRGGVHIDGRWRRQRLLTRRGRRSGRRRCVHHEPLPIGRERRARGAHVVAALRAAVAREEGVLVEATGAATIAIVGVSGEDLGRVTPDTRRTGVWRIHSGRGARLHGIAGTLGRERRTPRLLWRQRRRGGWQRRTAGRLERRRSSGGAGGCGR